MDASLLLATLRRQPGPIEDLIALLVDDLLARPVASEVDAHRLTETLIAALRLVVEDPAFSDRVDRSFREVLDRTTMPDWPPETRDTLLDIAARPWRLDAELVAELLDHEAVRALLAEQLTEVLQRFGLSIRDLVGELLRNPHGGRRGKISAVVGVARGVASGLAQWLLLELERQLERSIAGFVDDAVIRFVERSVHQLSSDRSAKHLSELRRHGVDVMLTQSDERFTEPVLEQLDDGLAEEVAALWVQLARWDGLEPALEALLGDALTALGERSLDELLDELPDGVSWRNRLLETLTPRAYEVVESEAFATWLEGVLSSSS